jgi:3-oxoacyl-(acyl-carrier-protein) synthase
MQTNTSSCKGRRVFLYGCGVVAPGAASLDSFLEEVWSQKVSLEPEARLNNAFLVGKPTFDFTKYRDWIASRHAPARFNQIVDKGGENTYLAVGAAIDALEHNPGLEAALKRLDPRVMVCIGSGLGDQEVVFNEGKKWERATWEWNHFWADPERNAACKAHLDGATVQTDAPALPTGFPAESYERIEAWRTWDSFWAPQNPALKEYLDEFLRIESMSMGQDVANDKLKLIRAKAKAAKQLQEKVGCPQPPWEAVSPNLLWNLPNGAAAQISMTFGIHGAHWNSNGACATFGLLLKEALYGIQSGDYDLAIVGTVDNTPPPQLVSSFYGARVLASGEKVGTPLCEMRGTHLAGGACVWIVGAEEVMTKLDLQHKGVEILGVGLSSDAEHIITPSLEGPKLAIREALRTAGVAAEEIKSWDMHATGTPGDFSELQLIEGLVPMQAVISARKGIFGHGMGSNGGWEITAQTLGLRKNAAGFTLPPGGISSDMLHGEIAKTGRRFALDKPVEVQTAGKSIVCGKLSMGVGGISSCVITRVSC